MKSAVIVIPVYKANPTEMELKSFKQCLKILAQYPVCIVTHIDLDLDIYLNEAGKKDIDIKYFSPHYFRSVCEYSQLMREHSFYKAFKEYGYMLIHQLDAWVFKDELEMWCSKGYDYIGAPWFTNYSSHEAGGKLWKVGNGGFSLRKISTFIRITNPRRRLKSTFEVFKTEYKNIRSIPTCILRSLGHRNKIGYFRNYYYYRNEDVYFCIEMQKFKKMRLHLPTPEEASHFSIECSPRYLFEINNFELPMGCHAWEKYDKEFINKYGQKYSNRISGGR